MSFKDSSSPRRGRRISRGRAAVVGTAVGALAGALVAAVPAGAAQPAAAPGEPCPEALPVGDLAAGQPVTGLTVSSGTTPDSFEGTIVGTLDDGIAPGIDMIIAKLDGSVITDPVTGAVDRGIWAGMSGSPVYTADGELIGAVSYSLAYAPSEYAGITPAEDMYAMLDHQAPARTPAVKTEIEGKVARRMAADRVVSKAQLDGGFRQLPMKVAVAGGLSTSKLRSIAREGGLDAKQFVAAPGGAQLAEEVPIEAGGNVAGTAAYGDITLSGIGTATAVCDGTVLGFGHPFLFAGKSDLTMHGADTLYIQRDDAGGSFKVANVAAPTGALTQDRWAGIAGQSGPLPPTTVVTTELSSPTGSRTGTTNASSADYLGYAASLHLYQNLLRVLDADVPGTSDLNVRIGLKGADGRSLTYRHRDVASFDYSAPEESSYGLWNDIDTILSNPYEDVTIDTIDVSGDITDKIEQLRIGKVERRAGGTWSQVRRNATIKAKAGTVLRLRVTLNPTRRSDSTRQLVRVDLRVPKKDSGRRGTLYISGDGYQFGVSQRGKDLKSMLAAMSNRPSNAAVNATLQFRRPKATVLDSAKAGAPVTGGLSFGVRAR